MEEGAYNFFARLGKEFVNKSYEEELEKIRQGGESKKYCFVSEGAVYVRARSRDIPAMIDCGEGDISTVAQDVKIEYELGSTTGAGAMSGRGFTSYNLGGGFGFPQSRYCLIGVRGGKVNWDRKIAGDEILVVATEYPYLAKKYLSRKYPNTIFDLMASTGKTENAVRVRNADAIFEIVGSGETLRKNDLEIFEEAMQNPTLVLVNNAAGRLTDILDRLKIISTCQD